jgi:hypothetical protein
MINGLLGDVMGPLKGLLGGNQGPASNTQVNMFPFSPGQFPPGIFNNPLQNIFPQGMDPGFNLPGMGGGDSGDPGFNIPGSSSSSTGGVTDQFQSLESQMQSAAASGDPYQMMQAQEKLQNWEQGVQLESSMYQEQHKMIDQMIQAIAQG